MAASKAPGVWPGGKVPDYVLEYVDWLITPESERQPKSKTQWAEDHGFSSDTPRKWERDDRVRWAIRERSDKLNLAPERMQQVMNALYAGAARGDVQAAKLYLEYCRQVTPPKPTSSIVDLSDEELASELEKYGFTRG